MLKNMKRWVGANRVWSAITRAARVVPGEPSLTCVDRSRNQVVATGPNIAGRKKRDLGWESRDWKEERKRELKKKKRERERERNKVGSGEMNMLSWKGRGQKGEGRENMQWGTYHHHRKSCVRYEHSHVS